MGEEKEKGREKGSGTALGGGARQGEREEEREGKEGRERKKERDYFWIDLCACAQTQRCCALQDLRPTLHVHYTTRALHYKCTTNARDASESETSCSYQLEPRVTNYV